MAINEDKLQAFNTGYQAGAAGTLDAQEVLRSPADDYALITDFMPMLVAPFMIAKVPFDLRKDFAPFGQTAWSYNVLVTHPRRRTLRLEGIAIHRQARRPGERLRTGVCAT